MEGIHKEGRREREGRQGEGKKERRRAEQA